MKNHLKGKAIGALVSALPVILPLFLVVIIATIGLNFFSGLRLNDEYEEKEYSKVATSPELLFLESIRNDEWSQEEYYGNFAFTKDDMKKIFEAVIANNGDVDQVTGGTEFGFLNSTQRVKGIYHASKIYFQYYWETWCVYEADVWNPNLENRSEDPNTGEVSITYGGYETRQTPLDSEWDEPKTIANWTVDGHEPINFVWGWHSGFRPTDKELVEYANAHASEDLEPQSNDPDHPYVVLDNKPKSEDVRDVQYTDELNPRYRIQWQPVYALCQMAASSEVEDWAEAPAADGGVEIVYRLSDDTLQKVIDIFDFDVVMGYDGAWDSKRSGYAQKEYIDDVDFARTTRTDYTRWDDAKTGAKTYKWDELDKISYTIEREGDWGITSNGTTLYKRRLYKIPASSILSASNGYETWTYYGTEIVEGSPETGYTENIQVTPDAVVTGNRQKYAFYEKFVSDSGDGYDSGKYDHELCAYDAGPGPKLTNLNKTHAAKCPSYTCGGNQHCIAVEEGIYECDAQLLEAAMASVVKEEWSWDKFLEILYTLPDSEDVYERYSKIRDACKEAEINGTEAYISEPIEESETFINRFVFEAPSGEGKKVIVGKGSENLISRLAGGKIIIPDISEDWDEDYEITGSLRVNHDFSVEQIQYLFNNFSGYLGHPTSLISKTPGMAEALVELQNRYASQGKPFDLVGLLAIANTESAYGTSNICRTKLNFVGWGAFDATPYQSAWGFSDQGVCGALVKNFEQILDNYIYGRYDQDSYYKMRWNNGVHQYCTSTTWPSTNAIGRRQMLKCLGVQMDDRKINNRLTDEQNEKLKEYVSMYYSEGSMTPPCDSRRVTSLFGYRNTGIKGASTNHKGIDIGASTQGVQGDLIRSAITGYVSHIGWITGGGYAVYIVGGGTNDDGTEGAQVVTKYMHLMDKSTLDYIQVGDVVSAGSPIGHMGNTGVSSGPHLHFQVEVNGEPVDPLPWLYGSWNIQKTGQTVVDGVYQ